MFAIATLSAPFAFAAVPLNYQDQRVQASIPYDAIKGQALVRSYLQPPGARRGILLSLSGYSPDPIVPCAIGNPGLGQRDDADIDWRLGFDIHDLKWCSGDDYIQRNAFVVVEIINRLRQQLQPGETFVLVGASMGGLVARYALVYMEHNALDHGVNLFISWDSPQMGAYVPVGVQFASRYFKDLNEVSTQAASRQSIPLNFFSGIATQLEQIDRPAPRQMVISYYDTGRTAPSGRLPASLQPLSTSEGPSAERIALLKELAQMGDYPKAANLRTVAIADGAPWGRQRPDSSPSSARRGSPDSLTFNSSIPPLKKSFPIPWTLGGVTLWTSTIHFAIQPRLNLRVNPILSTGQQTVFRSTLTLTATINGVPVDVSRLLNAANTVLAIKDVLKVPAWVPSAFLLGAVQPLVDFIAALVPVFPDTVEHRAIAPVAYAIVSGSFGGHTAFLAQQLRGFGTVAGGNYDNVFIPTTSALGLDLSPGSDLSRIPNLTSPRFHQIYFADRDMGHLRNTPALDNAICQEKHRALALPLISSLDPDSRSAGDGAFILTVTGANFTPGTKVSVNGKVRETRFFTSTRIQAAVLASDIPDNLSGGPFNQAAVEIPVSVLPTGAATGPTGCPATLQVKPSSLTLTPPTPTSADVVSATHTADWTTGCSPRNPTVSRTGNVITIDSFNPGGEGTFCTFVITPYSLTAQLGRLAAGAYQLNVTTTTAEGRTTRLSTRTFSVQQAPPVALAVSPVTLPAASGATQLTVNGDQFVSGNSRVLWNSAARPTEFVSATELRVSVSVEDLANQGIAQISVSTPGSAAPSLSASLPFAVTSALPVLAGLSSTGVTQGTSAFTLTVRGNYFTASSAISWDATPLPTRFLNTSTLAADIPATLLATPGSYPIAVADGDFNTPAQIFVVEPQSGTAPAISAIVNTASFDSGVSRGALATISGLNLSAKTEQASTANLPTTLAGIQVRVGGVLAPLSYVSPTLINFQVPFETPLGTVTVTLFTNGQSGPESLMQVADSALGVFQYQSSPGVTSPIITHADYRLVTADNPARPGETVVVWATGIGALRNAPATGQPAPSNPPALAIGPVDALINGDSARVSATVQFAGLTPGSVGLAQINITMPASFPVGAYLKLAIRVGGDSVPYLEIPIHTRR